MSQLVTGSSLNWTIARFTEPKDGERSGTLRAGFLGQDKIGPAMARADIAGFLLDQASDTRFHRAAPAISTEAGV